MGGGESGAGSSGSSAAPQAQAHIQVDVLYRSPSSLRPVFGDLLKDNKERLLSEGDCAAAAHARRSLDTPRRPPPTSNTRLLLLKALRPMTPPDCQLL
jgi:hypothetical protein